MTTKKLYSLCLGAIVLITSVLGHVASPARASEDGTVGLYGLFEAAVTNTRTYANPYDFRVVELRTRFTSTSRMCLAVLSTRARP